MNVKPKIDLPKNELDIVKAILKKYVPDCDVWAFGSRLKRTAKRHSDLDLAILSKQPLTLNILADLSQAFSESDLNIRVDILDFSRLDKEFQTIIKENHHILQG
jgi:predicted nucleotidyltransferase